jgi:hypothetical protein
MSSLTRTLVAVLLVSLVACGDNKLPADLLPSGEQTDTEESNNLPEPPDGKATVGGIVTIDGEPEVGQEVGLHPVDGAEVTTETAADGSFVFEAVEPGTYFAQVGIIVTGAEVTDAFGLAWDDPCSAEGYAVLNSGATDETTGESSVIAVASNEGGEGHDETPFDVDAGDRIEQNFEFVCS